MVHWFIFNLLSIKKNCKVIRAVSNDENGLTELSNKFEIQNYTSQMREKKLDIFTVILII